jgi:two-component system, OmpR family, alkaline phosphatase synthesis response regulator PhoP
VSASVPDPAHVLIVEDDEDIARLLAHSLARTGLTTEIRLSGADVLTRIRRDRPDLLLLDVMLPGLDGRDIARAIRSNPETAGLPIIMITARAEEADRVAGLELGADDYITKPFSPNEVVARVRALLRRTSRAATPASAPQASLTLGPLRMDLDSHVVTVNGSPVHLTAKEFLLLQYFLEHRGRVLSRDLLLTDVWGYRYTGGTRTVDVHVRRLREKLPSVAEAIVTVKQFGYRLVDESA